MFTQTIFTLLSATFFMQLIILYILSIRVSEAKGGKCSDECWENLVGKNAFNALGDIDMLGSNILGTFVCCTSMIAACLIPAFYMSTKGDKQTMVKILAFVFIMLYAFVTVTNGVLLHKVLPETKGNDENGCDEKCRNYIYSGNDIEFQCTDSTLDEGFKEIGENCLDDIKDGKKCGYRRNHHLFNFYWTTTGIGIAIAVSLLIPVLIAKGKKAKSKKNYSKLPNN